MRFLLIPALLLAFSASAQAGLTLADAVHYAVDHAPSLDAARRTREIRELERSSAVAKFLPTADIDTTNGLQLTSPASVTSPWSSSLSLTLNENLYDNGESLTRYRIAGKDLETAALTLDQSREKLSLDVVTQFLTFSLNRKLLEVKREQHALLQKQYDSMAEGYRQGLKTRKDYLRFKTQLQRADIDLLAAENAIQKSETDLRRLLGAPGSYFEFSPQEPAPLSVSIPDAPPSLEKTYEYRLAETQKESQKLNEDLTRRKYWPQVFLTTSASYLNSNYLGSGLSFPTTGTTAWSALLELRYNIWDWGSRRRDIEIAEHNTAIRADQLDDGLLATRAAIEAMMLEIARLKADYKLSDELLKLTQESFDTLDEEYRNGKISYLDIITGLNDLLDAKVGFYTAYFSLIQDAAQYRYYEGNLYDTVGTLR